MEGGAGGPRVYRAASRSVVYLDASAANAAPANQVRRLTLIFSKPEIILLAYTFIVWTAAVFRMGYIAGEDRANRRA